MQTSKVKIDDNQDKVSTTLKGLDTKEHDKIQSRTTGRMYEISLGPQPDGLVPKNPFLSKKQNAYMHVHPEILGKKGLKEWEQATDYSSLPNRVKK